MTNNFFPLKLYTILSHKPNYGGTTYVSCQQQPRSIPLSRSLLPWSQQFSYEEGLASHGQISMTRAATSAAIAMTVTMV